MPNASGSDPAAELRDALQAIDARLAELRDLCRDTARLLERADAAELGAVPAGAPRHGRTTVEGEDGAPFTGETAVSGRPSEEGSQDDLDPPQAALLVAVTARGGTLDGPALAALADAAGVTSAALEALFGGAEPRLERRPGGGARLTERGVESAAGWRDTLPAGLLRLVTEL